MITGAPGATSVTSSSALFLNLSLASGASTTLTVSAAVPCGPSTYTWGMAAKQSNNFNGTGNNFQLDPASAKNLNGIRKEIRVTIKPAFGMATPSPVSTEGHERASRIPRCRRPALHSHLYARDIDGPVVPSPCDQACAVYDARSR